MKFISYGSLLISEKAFNEIHKKALVKSIVATNKSVIIEYTSKDGTSRGTMELYDRKHFNTAVQTIKLPHR